MKDFTPAELKVECQAFLATDLGQYYITQLSLQYNDLHQKAERDRDIMHVVEAAGVKRAIDFLTGHAEEPVEQP